VRRRSSVPAFDAPVVPFHTGGLLWSKGAQADDVTDEADVNAKDGSGVTPLDWAAKNGHKAVVELLRQHGGRE